MLTTLWFVIRFVVICLAVFKVFVSFESTMQIA